MWRREINIKERGLDRSRNRRNSSKEKHFSLGELIKVVRADLCKGRALCLGCVKCCLQLCSACGERLPLTVSSAAQMGLSGTGPYWHPPLLGVCSDLYGEIIGCILIAVVQSDACAWSVL